MSEANLKPPKQEKYPNLYAGGVPGNAGSNGRPPNVIRDFSRGAYDRIAQKIAPACEAMAEGISEIICGTLEADDPRYERGREAIRRLRDAGFTSDQLLKATAMFANAGLPKQSELVLESSDVLSVVAECAGKVYGPGRVEELMKLVTATLNGDGV